MKEVLNSLITNMPYPLCIIDCDLNFIFANKMYYEIHKIKQDIIGCNIKNVLNKYAYEKMRRKCKDVLQSGNISVCKEYDSCIIIPIKNLNHKITSFIIASGISDIFNKFIDEKQKIEEERNLMKDILNVLPEMVFCRDTEGRYIYANKECREFYREQGIDNILGKTNNEINADKLQVGKFMESDKKVMETLKIELSEAEFVNNYGQKSCKEIAKVPIMNDDGSVRGVVGRCIDITYLKRNEEKLENLSYTDALTGAKNRAYFEYMDKKYSKEGKFPIGIIMGDNNGLKLVNDTFGHEQGDRLLIETTNAMKRACSGLSEVYRFGGDEFAILIPNASIELCEKTIKNIDEECSKFKSELFNISISLGHALKLDKNTNIYSALKIAENQVYKQKLLKGSSFKSSILGTLKLALASKSDEKEEHNARVAEKSIQLAEKINMSISDCNELKVAAELHDIGIIGIKDEIIKKKKGLTAEEFEEMKTHCERGYRIVKSLSYFDNIADSILYHHERWDGKGYPKGLKGEEIPLFARIISICDTFDVMTNERHYRKGKFTVDEALKEIKKCSGTQFDPNLVDLFISLFK
ncbi:MAG: HD domain-containing phosphohydrolase [Clostridium sp.]